VQTLSTVVNGSEVSLDISPSENLADFLRERLGLKGTKIGCGEGECGACTVLLDGIAVNACITPAMKANGRRVTTVEGLTVNRQMHVIQQAFHDATAVQCGYCTPGLVMASKALLDANPEPTREEIMAGISGNLCRCTGYYQIVDAVALASKRMAEEAAR
jgi:carbon-monoxide dehydrogenase small subunit